GQVSQVAEADEHYSATTLIDHTGSPYMLKYLKDFFDIQDSRVRLDYNPNSPVDVEIYLGYDAEGASLP
ncbi:MAG TPA: hypothetical protein VFZ76_08190, partial [Anaerolineales bacterium]